MRSGILFCALSLVCLSAIADIDGFIIPTPDSAPICNGKASKQENLKSCSQYWQCDEGQDVAVLEDCKGSLHFSQRAKTCVLPGEADCKVYFRVLNIIEL